MVSVCNAQRILRQPVLHASLEASFQPMIAASLAVLTALPAVTITLKFAHLVLLVTIYKMAHVSIARFAMDTAQLVLTQLM